MNNMLKLIGDYKIVVFLVVIMLVGAVAFRMWRNASSPTVSNERGPADAPVARSVASRSAVRECTRVAPKSTERLPDKDHPQDITMVLTTKGKGEDANWGVKGLCSFVLTYCIKCRSEILTKSETASGEVKVVEKRTYTSCRQRLEVSECDAQLDLFNTLPLERAITAAKVIGEILSKIPEPDVAAAGEAISKAATGVGIGARTIDGKSIRSVLNEFAVNVPERLESQVNEFISKKIGEGDAFRVEKLEGKSYLVNYYQDKDTAAPLQIHFTYADGSEIPSDSEEMLILRRVNAFIDSGILPDDAGNAEIGKRWSVDAAKLDCMLDPYAEGTYSGEVTIARLADYSDGDWRLGVEPTSLAVVDEENRRKTTGEVTIKKGEAKVDKDKSCLKALTVSGACKLTKLTEHHLLFKSRVGGWCDFSATLLSEPAN